MDAKAPHSSARTFNSANAFNIRRCTLRFRGFQPAAQAGVARRPLMRMGCAWSLELDVHNIVCQILRDGRGGSGLRCLPSTRSMRSRNLSSMRCVTDSSARTSNISSDLLMND